MSIQITAYDRDLLLSHPETKTITRQLLAGESVLVGTEAQYNEMRDACSELLQRIGFDEGYAPTKEGLVLERLIDELFV
jgi:hypothetical protein